MIISHVPVFPFWVWPGSQKHLPLHPRSIHVLSLMYSLQHISHALTSHWDMCVHICTQVYKAYLYIFSSFIHVRPCHAHSILLFYQPQQVQLVLSRGLSPLYLLYLFLFLLAPVGVWTDPISLDQWILPCESQTLGDTGYGKGSWDRCDHHALE